MDRSVIEARLAVLESEFSAGRRLLAERETQVLALREQLLRISGAMRVLSELLGNPDPQPALRTEVARQPEIPARPGTGLPPGTERTRMAE